MAKMPWKATRVMDQRLLFIAEYLKGDHTVTELCEAFGISRKTGHKFIDRFEELGPDGLKDLPRTPHSRPHAVTPEVKSLLLLTRQAHPRWGPRKVLAYLKRHHRSVTLPAPSTVGAFYKQLGLVARSRRRGRVLPKVDHFTDAKAPNDVWTADFKGWFRTGDGYRCDPLTLSDAFSRFLVRSDIVRTPDYVGVKPVFESAFREYGLPRVLRSDNGPPFATAHAIAGLSQLAIWLIKIGVMPERITPGCPQENGRHERMHLTLKIEAASPPSDTREAQKAALSRFRHEYNHERPHEAIGQRTPAELYTPSPRPFPRRIPDQPEYPDHMVVRRVATSGAINWSSTHVQIGRVLMREVIALEQVTEQHWKVYFGPLLLGLLDDHAKRLTPVANRAVPRRNRSRKTPVPATKPAASEPPVVTETSAEPTSDATTPSPEHP